METIREYFGFGGYTREVEGYFSWQHIAFVTAFMAVMIAAAVFFGIRNKNKSPGEKNSVLIAAAILMIIFKIIEVSVIGVREQNPMQWKYMLPLFLCSIQLITIPLAAFSRGRVREASLDFVLIFGVLGAVLGTYAAGNNYGSYPVVCFDNTISALTHTVSGFAAIYIAISGMSSMRRKNIPITYAIIVFFCAAAYIANVLIPYNYMFMMRADGTPYEIIYGWTGGSPVLYPIAVVVLFLIYIAAFYLVFYLITGRNRKRKVG